MILLDTDHFSVLTDRRHAQHARLVARLSEGDEPVAIPVIAVEEQLRAWLAQVHRAGDAYRQISPYDRLIRLIEVLREWEIMRWSEQAADEFARLQKARVHIGTQDLKIGHGSKMGTGSEQMTANAQDNLSSRGACPRF
jgi:tRNA(fMet)-specific endonuclease VapC